MAGQEFQYIQEILKDMYAPAIVNQIPKKSILWAIIKKKISDFYGKQLVIPVLLGMPESVGARAANDYSLPAAQKSSYDQAYISMKKIYGRVGVDGLAIESAKGKGGWVDVMTQEIKNVTDAFSMSVDRQLMGCGKGIMGTVNGAVSGQVITVKDAGGIVGDTPTTKWFRIGQVLDIYSTAGAIHADSVVVSAISATTITVVGTITSVVTTDYIYAENTFESTTANGEIMGIDGVVSASDTPGSTFEGIARSANELWKAYVGTSIGLLDETKVQEALDGIESGTDGSAPDLLLTTFAIRNKLIAIMQGDRQVVNKLDLQAGWKAISYVGGNVELPLTTHPKCPVGYMYFLSRPHLKLYVLQNLVWDDKGGGIIKPVAGFDMYEAWFKLYGNLGTDCSNAHGKLTGVTVSA